MENIRLWFDANAGWIGFAGLVVGVVGVVTGFVFFWLSRKFKRFAWQEISKASIINVGASHLPLQVNFDNRVIANPNIIVFRIGNAGKAEVKRDDYDKKVRIVFDRSSIVTFSVVGQSRSDIQVTATLDGPQTLAIEPTLLNAGEWVDIQFVTDGPLEGPKVFARIAGQYGDPVDLAGVKSSKWFQRMLWAVIVALLGWSTVGLFKHFEWVSWLILMAMILSLLPVFALAQSLRVPKWSKE